MYHLAQDEVAKLRAFRQKRDQFAAHIRVGDVQTVYPLWRVCEMLDKQEMWHYAHAQAAIDDSQNRFLNDLYILSPHSRISHDPWWLPRI